MKCVSSVCSLSKKKCNKYIFCISLKANRWLIAIFCRRFILMLSTLDFQYMCRCQHMFLIPCQFCSHSKKAQCLTNTLSAKLVLFRFSIEEHFIRVRLDFALYATGLGRKWEVAEGLAHTNVAHLYLLHPPTYPPLSIDLSVPNIFQSDLAGFSFLDGWTWKRGIYLVWNPSTEVVFWIVRGEKKRAFTWVSQFRLITWSEINGRVWTRAK